MKAYTRELLRAKLLELTNSSASTIKPARSTNWMPFLKT